MEICFNHGSGLAAVVLVLFHEVPLDKGLYLKIMTQSVPTIPPLSNCLGGKIAKTISFKHYNNYYEMEIDLLPVLHKILNCLQKK